MLSKEHYIASSYKHVDAVEGIWQVISELTKGEHGAKYKGLLFYIHSCKRILFINPNEQPPRTLRIRRHGDHTVIYTIQNLPNHPGQDHVAEVLRDHDGLLLFREQHQLLSPRQFLAKLCDLLGIQAELA